MDSVPTTPKMDSIPTTPKMDSIPTAPKMDSIPTTPIPASDLPLQQGNNRSMSRRLSTRSFKDATYPEDLANELGHSPRSGSRRGGGLDPGMRTKTLQRNSSVAQRVPGSASARFDTSISIRIGKEDDDDDDDDEENAADNSRDENEGADSTEEGDQDAKGDGEEPVRMSLMALLGESMMGEDEDDEDEEGGGDVGGGENNSCCVCQVKHKGAAFVPCGHSFCRLCSRELWVEGGNCPLCNNFILEILDIF